MCPLIISAQLFERPSEFLATRALTMMAKVRGWEDILIETTEDDKDLYFHFLRPQGGMDFAKQIICMSELVQGVRVDYARHIWPTITTDRIVFDNVMKLLAQAASFL